MPLRPLPLKSKTRRAIAEVFAHLDYRKLGSIYCDVGGQAFWRERRDPCRRLGTRLAEVLRRRLAVGGRSLYVGAGVAEVPVLAMETLELARRVVPCSLRRGEVDILNRACERLPVRFLTREAASVRGRFDHLWIVSVLNDPERFPELSALSYGRADPVRFHPRRFEAERKKVQRLASACLGKVTRPGLVTTSVEEIPWITDWCARRGVRCVVEQEDYPTAIVGDPICFIRLG